MPKQSLWDSVVGIAKSVLPNSVGFLANAILPGTGGVASNLISGVLGCDDTPQAITRALQSATPKEIQQITAEANRHKETLVELSGRNEALRLQDVQSARQREMAIVKTTGKKDINLYILSYIFISAFFVLVTFMLFVEIPDDNIGPVNQLFGALAMGVGTVLQYFFGSSKSSADKTALMSNGAGK